MIYLIRATPVIETVDEIISKESSDTSKDEEVLQRNISNISPGLAQAALFANVGRLPRSNSNSPTFSRPITAPPTNKTLLQANQAVRRFEAPKSKKEPQVIS